MKKAFSSFLVLVLIFMIIGVVSAEVNAVTPSTNDINRTNGWSHVNEISVNVGEVTLDFIQPRNFYACFEYRTDGDTSQVIDEEHWLEYYGVVPPGDLQQYPYLCLSTISSQARTILANEYVEVRMMFGGEGDERFDWTRFDVIPLPVPTEKDQCKDDGWKELYRSDGSPFMNQGDCIQYVNTGK